MASNKSKRVAFTFDERSLTTLRKMTEEGNFSSMADTVHKSSQISRTLQTQAQQGFTEIIVRDPETEEERMLVIPSLQSIPKRGR